MPPVAADKKDEGEDDKVEKILALVEKSVAQSNDFKAALQKSNAENDHLKRRIASLEKALTPPKSGKEVGGYKPTDHEEVKNMPHPDGSVKGSKDTTSTEGAITSDRLSKADDDEDDKKEDKPMSEDSIAKAVKKALEEAGVDLSGSTPMPWGMSAAPGVAKARRNLPGLIAEIIAKDREFCGAGYSSEDAFGLPSGNGDMNARELTARYLNEQFGGAL